MTWKDMSNALSPSCQSVLGEAITVNSKNPPITVTMCAGQGTFKPQISLWTPRSPLQSSPILLWRRAPRCNCPTANIALDTQTHCAEQGNPC